MLEAGGAATAAEGVTIGPAVVVGMEIERGLLAGVAGPGGADGSGASLLNGAGVDDDGVVVSAGFAPEEAACEGGRLDSLSKSSGFSSLMGGVALLLGVLMIFWGVAGRQSISEKIHTRRIVLRPSRPKALFTFVVRG